MNRVARDAGPRPEFRISFSPRLRALRTSVRWRMSGGCRDGRLETLLPRVAAPADGGGGVMTDPQAPSRSARPPGEEMCRHHPRCPDALAPDRGAARTVASHPEQGWSLLCNGVVLFDDTGMLLPDGRTVGRTLSVADDRRRGRNGSDIVIAVSGGPGQGRPRRAPAYAASSVTPDRGWAVAVG